MPAPRRLQAGVLGSRILIKICSKDACTINCAYIRHISLLAMSSWSKSFLKNSEELGMPRHLSSKPREHNTQYCGIVLGSRNVVACMDGNCCCSCLNFVAGTQIAMMQQLSIGGYWSAIALQHIFTILIASYSSSFCILTYLEAVLRSSTSLSCSWALSHRFHGCECER
jgi:hypothetical protein